MTTILELKEPVQRSIDEIRADFDPADMRIEPDGEGGARIMFGPVALGSQYAQRESWIGAHIPAQIPYADIYPIFFRGDLSRIDGNPLVAPLTSGHTFMGVAAVQASRRSNKRDAHVDTVKLKFKKVLAWVNSQ